MQRDRASFRDPDGYVFHTGNGVYRAITSDTAPVVLAQYRDFFETAVATGLLLPYSRPTLDQGPANVGEVIQPQILPLVSYPYEWSFDQLKDAALLTLDLNILALAHGLTLKDATAFNVQYVGGKMRFIDHLSFESCDGHMPWAPYSQFCRHFLNPLAIGAYRDFHVNALFRIFLDGIPSDLTGPMLPVRGRIRPALFVNIVLHNMFIRRSDKLEDRVVSKSKRGHQVDLLRQLRDSVARLNPARPTSTWSNYYENTNYDDAAFVAKREIVDRFLKEGTFKVAWDVGANQGEFSRIAAQHTERVLALDVDHNAVNSNYVNARDSNSEKIFPLVHDITNPAPDTGFDLSERSALIHRSQPDIVMALALIHHLCITHNIPFTRLAEHFFSYGCELILEFVGREDSQFQRLIRSKSVAYEWYNQEKFERVFSERYDVTHKLDVPGTQRTIYVMRPKTTD